MSTSIEGWILAGNKDGQHGVIAANLGEGLAAEIARRIDLPGSLPSEFRTSELVAFGCFRYAERVVFYEISSDPSVERVGMARSGAVVVGLQEASTIDDPYGMLAKARSTRLTGSPDEIVVDPPSAIPRCVPLLSHLIRGKAMTSSETRTGDMVRAVWSALPRSLRPGFSARLCFTPEDLPERADIALGFIPESLRWRCPSELMVADPCGASQDQGPNERLAHRLADGEARTWEEFAERYSLRLSSFRDLDLVARIERAFVGEAELDELVRALRYTLSLTMEDATAQLIDELSERIADHREEWTSEDVATFRNLDLKTSSPLKKALGVWTGEQLGEHGHKLALVLPEVWGAGARDWWSVAIDRALSKHRGRVPKEVLSAFLARLEGDEDASAFASAIAGSEHVDADLSTLVSGAEPVPPPLASRLDANLFPEATVVARLATAEDLIEIVEAGRGIVTEESRSIYFETMIDRVDKDGLPALVALDEGREMTEPLLSRLSREPDGFDAIDLSNGPSQRLLAEALVGGFVSADRLGVLLVRILDELIEGTSLEPELVEALVEHVDATFPPGPSRPRVWAVLPDTLRDVMLRRAARAQLAQLAQDGSGDPEPEVLETLRSRALADARSDALQTADLTMWSALAELEPSPGYEYRQRLLAILDGDRSQALADVVSMAETLVRKDPGSVMSALVSRYRARTDLVPAWGIIRDHLRLWDRWLLPDTQIGQAEWDRGLVEELARLYPEGPLQEDVWERAGGRNADLPKSSSGMDGWRRAMRMVGKGARVSRSRILATALDDYPRNANLAILRDKRPR